MGFLSSLNEARKDATSSVTEAGKDVIRKADSLITDIPVSKKDATNVAKIGALAAGAYFAAPLVVGALGGGAAAGATSATSFLPASLGGTAGALGAGAAGSMFGAAAPALGAAAGGFGLSSLIGPGLSLAGGLMSGSSAKDAARTNSNAQIEAARIAADAAKFRPVGVATRFGNSRFSYDRNGNLTGAGYAASPLISGLQRQVEAPMSQFANQFGQSMSDNRGMMQGGKAAMNLGNQYLATSPQEQAKKYLDEQMALLNPQRERSLSGLMSQLVNQGRLGLAVGGTSDGMRAANPELEAYYNAQLMQDRQLAADATRGGQQYAQFGSDMIGQGGNLMSQYYQNQSDSSKPLNAALNLDAYMEGLSQNAMDQGINIGAKGTASNAQSGLLLSQGMQNAANTMQPANAYNPWAYATGMMGQTFTDRYR